VSEENKTESSRISGDIHAIRTKEIIFSIRRLMQAGEHYTKELNKIYNVSAAQINCLLALYENGPLPPSQIAKHVMVNSSTVTGIIDRLEKKNLVKRLRISQDRRVITVELTRSGKILAENAPPPIQQKIIDGLNKLSPDEIDKIALTLKGLIDLLDVQYYQVPEIEDHLLTDIEETSDLIRETFIKAVKKRLLADQEVPVGSFCSGGLDSSLVAAIAADEIPHLHTFVVGMEDEFGVLSDDVKAARIAAKHIGSTHHELLFTEGEYYEALPIVIKKLESYDPSLVRCAVPCYFTCKLAAEYVTVVLTGEGADEIFTGYHYMKHFPFDKLNMEARRCIGNLHNINLQRADRMGMYFSLELRVPFLDEAMVDLSMKIPPELKIREHNGAKIEKWILRKAFEDTNYLPEEILWRYKVQYTQGAGCESLGETLAHKEMSQEEFERIKAENPKAIINSREAAYYFKIFRQFHPQNSILGSIGIWTGFDFAEERERVRGTVDGGLKHDHIEEEKKAKQVA